MHEGRHWNLKNIRRGELSLCLSFKFNRAGCEVGEWTLNKERRWASFIVRSFFLDKAVWGPPSLASRIEVVGSGCAQANQALHRSRTSIFVCEVWSIEFSIGWHLRRYAVKTYSNWDNDKPRWKNVRRTPQDNLLTLTYIIYPFSLNGRFSMWLEIENSAPVRIREGVCVSSE